MWITRRQKYWVSKIRTETVVKVGSFLPSARCCRFLSDLCSRMGIHTFTSRRLLLVHSWPEPLCERTHTTTSTCVLFSLPNCTFFLFLAPTTSEPHPSSLYLSPISQTGSYYVTQASLKLKVLLCISVSAFRVLSLQS